MVGIESNPKRATTKPLFKKRTSLQSSNRAITGRSFRTISQDGEPFPSAICGRLAATLSKVTADTDSECAVTSRVEPTTCTADNSQHGTVEEAESLQSFIKSAAIRQVEKSIARMLVRTPQVTPPIGIIFEHIFDKINAETSNFLRVRGWLHDIQNTRFLNAWSRATNKEKGGFSRLMESTSSQKVRVDFLFLRTAKIR